MNYLNIILIGIIIYIGYLFTQVPNNKKQVNTGNIKLEKFSSYNDTDILVNEILDEVQDWDKTFVQNNKIKRNIIKPNLLDIMYHNDYRDVITVLNDMVPTQRQLFNIANIPVKYSEPHKSEVKALVIGFINVLNNKTLGMSKTRNKNTGWDEPLADPTMESGWERVQRELGLQTSLYSEPLGNTGVKLIALEKTQKYETDDEIKYTCLMIIQKNLSNDQMLIKISFVINKRELNDENNFFKKMDVNLNVVTEQISIEGYLSDKGTDSTKLYENIKDTYYDFDGFEHNNIMNNADIEKQLLAYQKKRAAEIDYRNSTLDEFGRDYHNSLPIVTDRRNQQMTKNVKKC